MKELRNMQLNVSLLIIDTCIETITYGHTHYTGGPNGTTVPDNCLVTVNRYLRAMQCHCGEVQATYYSNTHHSVR